MQFDLIIQILIEYIGFFEILFGIFLAFSLDRALDWRRDRKDRKKLREMLHKELARIQGLLVGNANLFHPDIWKSATSSGKIQLLDVDDMVKLSEIYADIQSVEYEA